MALQKRAHGAANVQAPQDNPNHELLDVSSINNQHAIITTPASSPSPSPHRKNKTSHKHPNSTDHTTLIMLILFCIFLTILNIMHHQIDQFERESQQQTHFLRRAIDNLLFDPMSLPQFSTLRGRYDGCLLIDGMIAPHNFKNAVFVDKDIEIVNGTGTNLIQRQRLRAYDYDEVKGLVASFNNALVFGTEPVVYDCHVKFRPGGANALNLDEFEEALNFVSLGADGKKVSVQNYGPELKILNGTVVLIAQYWGERFYHWMSEVRSFWLSG